MNKDWQILLYVPNLIGYLRFALLTIAWCYIELPQVFLPLYMVNVCLDGLDGYAARRLQQVSDFGAWLDVVVDVIGRGIVWCFVSKFGYAVPAWEWIVFSANQSRTSCSQWRESFKNAPSVVQNIMKDGFKTGLGTLVIFGIHLLPLWLYIEKEVALLTSTITSCIFCTFLLGRLLGLIAEAWCVYTHVCLMLDKKHPT